MSHLQTPIQPTLGAFLDFQTRAVRSELIALGWTDQTLRRLPKHAKRNVHLFTAASITPDDWARWDSSHRKVPSTHVLVVALQAGLDKHEAAAWSQGQGTASDRAARARFAASVGLSHADYQRIQAQWSRAGDFRDHMGMHRWYWGHIAAQIPVGISVRWHPHTPMWVLRWAATGHLVAVPEDDQVALGEGDVWLAANLCAGLDIPMEILALVAARWAEGLAGAEAHAAHFDDVPNGYEWVRVQWLKAPPRAHTIGV